jgi:antitoxin component of MazEF toxin-antitoxin module
MNLPICIQKVLKVGNSIAVVLPSTIASQLNVQRGDQVAVSCLSSTEILLKKLPKDLRAELTSRSQ